MVDAHALGACGCGRAGSNPASPTIPNPLIGRLIPCIAVLITVMIRIVSPSRIAGTEDVYDGETTLETPDGLDLNRPRPWQGESWTSWIPPQTSSDLRDLPGYRLHPLD